MKKRLLSVAFLMGAMAANAQVGIGTATPNKSAELLIEAKNRGLLIPNVALTSTTDKVTITNGNVESLLVYATTPQGDITPGYYYWDGVKWARLTADKDIPKLVSDQFSNILKLDANKVANLIKGLFSETITNVDKQKAGKYIYTNEKGAVQSIDVVGDITEILKGGVYPAFDTVLKQFIDKAETVTSLLYNGTTRTLSYTDEDNKVNNIDIAQILKDHTTNSLAVNGSELISTVNGVKGKTDLTNKISTGMLQEGSVTNDKLSAGKGDDNRVAVADKDGNVTFKTQKEIVEGNTSNDLALDGNKLASTVNGKTSTVELTENSVVSSKGITGTGIVVEGGANATLKEVKLSIADGAITPEKMAAGKPGTVLVTDKDGNVKWVKEDAAIIKDMVKANETISTLKDNGNGTFTYYNEIDYGKDGQLKPGATGTPFDANTLNVTSADGVYTFTDKSGKELAKIDTNAKASGYDNGTSGLTSKDVQGAIDELVGKINKVAGTKGTLSSTDIVVTKGQDAILKDVTLAIATGAITTDKLGAGAVIEDKIGQGAVTEDKIKAGKDGQVLVTVTENGKEVTKWVDKKDATSNKLEAKGDKIVSTVNGQEAELKLEGDVILKDGKTEVSKLQGNDLATANVAEGEVLSFEGGKWINKVPTVNTDNVTNGKALTSTEKTIEIKGAGATALLKDVQIDVANGAITADKLAKDAVTSDKIKDGAVSTGKIEAGNEGQVLVTVTENGKEVTKWIPANDLGNTVTAGNGLTKTGNEIKLGGKLTEKTTLTTTPGKELVIEGLEDVKTNPSTNNIVLTDPITGELKQTSAKNLLEDTIAKSGSAEELKAKTLKGEGITVTAGDKVGTTLEVVNALLKDVILGIADGAITEGKLGAGAVTTEKLGAGAVTTEKIADGAVTPGKLLPGTEGQVLVTEGGTTKWVDKDAIVTTNVFTSNGNDMTSNVNGESTTVDIINSVSNALDKDNKLVTTVNGVPSTSVDLTPAIQAGQKTTSVDKGSDKVTVVGTTTGKNTEYVVDVVEANIKLEELGGQLPADKLKPGTDGQTLVTVKDSVTGEPTTKWVDKKDATSNKLETIGDKIISTVNGQPAELKLEGDVILKDGKTEVSKLQGNDLVIANVAEGEVLSFEGGKWINKRPTVNTDNVTNGKALTSAEQTIEIKGAGATALLKDVQIDVADNAITSAKIKDGEVKTADLADKNVTADKLGADVADAGKVATVNTDGTVSYKEIKVGDIKDAKNITSKTIAVGGVSGSTLQDVTLEIVAGTEGQVMVTGKGADGKPTTEWVDQLPADKLTPGTEGQVLVTEGGTTKWVDKKDATSNEFTLGADNKLVSNVNGVSKEVDLTSKVTDGMLNGGQGTDGRVAVSDKDGKVTYQEVTGKALNGKALTSRSIKVFGGSQALLDGTVIEVQGGTKDGQVLVTTTKEIVVGKDANGADIKETHKVTEWVDQLPADKLTPGTDGQVLVTEGGVTKWAESKEIELKGDVTGKPGETKVSAIQGTLVDAAGTKTDGQALVFEGGKWVPGTPNVTVDKITDAKTLTTDNIILVNGVAELEKSVLADAKLSIANNAITADKLKAGDTNQVLTTVDNAGKKTVEWKTPVVDITKKGNLTSTTENLLTVDKGDGVVLQNVSLTVNQGNFELNHIGGSLNVNQITAGNNNQVLTTVDNGGTKTVIWADKEKPTTVTGGKTETGDVEVIPGTGDKANEFTVDVKSAMPKVFYMPPVVFDTSDRKGGAVQTRELHKEYLAQFVNVNSKLRSGDAPASIPNTATATDLHYYVTYHDNTVVEIVSISNDGKLKYKVIGDSTPATFMTIVFVVK